MSLLIEMPPFEEQSPNENIEQILRMQVASLLHHPEFNAANIMQI